MSRSEPLTLYAPVESDYALVSWRTEMPLESSRLAIRRQSNGEEIPTPSGKGAEKNRQQLHQQLKQRGGISAHLVPATGEFRISVTPSAAPGYRPPEKVLILGWGDTIREHKLSAGEFRIKPAEHALVPVDSDAQLQLERWIEGLKGLPGDLRIAMLQGVIHEGLLDRHELDTLERKPLPSSEASKEQRPAGFPWIWIVLAALLGMAAGAGGYYGFLLETGDKAADVGPPATLYSKIADLDSRIAQSTDAEIAQLYVTHVAPLRLEPPKSPARRTAEAWMVLKLALHQHKTQPNISWTAEANRDAKDQFDKVAAQLDPSVRMAVNGMSCIAGPPPAGTMERGFDCSKIDWAKAQKGLESLNRYAADPAKAGAANPQESISQDSNSNAPDDPGKAKAGQDKAGKNETAPDEAAKDKAAKDKAAKDKAAPGNEGKDPKAKPGKADSKGGRTQ